MSAIDIPAPERKPPEVIGLHHVRIPVTDPFASQEWYASVLGFAPLMIVEEEDEVVGVVIEHDCGVSVGLHHDATCALCLRGFVVLSLSVQDLESWAEHLDRAGVPYEHIDDAHLGRYLQLTDPDRLVVSLHTPNQPSADEA